jgi:serine/threonine protein kinase
LLSIHDVSWFDRLASWLRGLVRGDEEPEGAPVSFGRRFSLEAHLDSGGMGQVYVALDRRQGRRVAVKLTTASSTSQRMLFRDEAHRLAMLHHRAVPSLVAHGALSQGQLYLAMELVDGLNLRDLVQQQGPLPPARAAHVLDQMLAALEEIHAAGMVHRDVKPRNVMVARYTDAVKLVDFGLVAPVEEQLSAHQMGTPVYLAPEVLLGRRYDVRSEIYSVGLVAYVLLTGRHPFAGDEDDMIRRQILVDPARPSDVSPSPLPPGLDEIVLACLAKAPAERPSSVVELRRRLAALNLPAWKRSAAERAWAVVATDSMPLPCAPTQSAVADLDTRASMVH